MGKPPGVNALGSWTFRLVARVATVRSALRKVTENFNARASGRGTRGRGTGTGSKASASWRLAMRSSRQGAVNCTRSPIENSSLRLPGGDTHPYNLSQAGAKWRTSGVHSDGSAGGARVPRNMCFRAAPSPRTEGRKIRDLRGHRKQRFWASATGSAATKEAAGTGGARLERRSRAQPNA
jgi:hypothetical protein